MANNWISVSPLSGHGNGSITISAALYDQLTARTGTITVRTNNIESSVTVTQSAYTEPTLIYVDPQTLLFDSSGGTRSIQITALDDWEWINYPIYMEVSEESGSAGNYDISITVPQNTELSVRTEKLAIKCGDEVLFLPFTQYAGQTVVPTGLTIDSISWVTDVPASGGTASSANCTYVATVHYSDSSTLDVSSRVNMSGILVVSASTNTERHSVGLLTLNASIWGLSAQTSVTVYQAAFANEEIFHFTALDDGSTVGLTGERNLEYMVNSGAWTSWNGSDITLNEGDKLYIRGDNSTFNGVRFTTSKPIECSGSISYLFAKQGNVSEYLTNYVCNELFMESKITTAPMMPTEGLSAYCYRNMFKDCIYLRSVPSLALPSTALWRYCYSEMFSGCISLVSAPSLPATDIEEYCYYHMFEGCTSLVNAPSLPATVMKASCYNSMFKDCTSLVTAPSLPATTLKGNCYYGMFSGCSSLTTAPVLPAEKAAGYCYHSMFADCTSLTTAPSLPATVLDANCYASMFSGCTALTTAPSSLPATSATSYCYYGMFSGCTAITTAPVISATRDASYSFAYMFKGCSSLSYIKCLLYSQTYTNSTSEWVSGVSSTGTFVKDYRKTWESGMNGIPVGWTVVAE